MDNVRGLRTRLCLKCTEVTPHRTLYVRTTIDGKRRWLQLFWVCTTCGSLNHVVLPIYRLGRESSPPTSALPFAIINVLENGPLDFDELIVKLRRRGIPGISHIFNSEVALAIEFLKSRDVVSEEERDCTERALDVLRVKSAGSKRLGICPVDSKNALVSLYAQKQEGASHGMRLTLAGVFCLGCEYRQIDL